MSSKKVRMEDGEERVTVDLPLDHPRKVPPVAQSVTPEESDLHTSSKMKKALTPIDITTDVMRRIQKDMGMYKFIPLSTGRLADLWWRPVEVNFAERARSTGMISLNLSVQILIDSSPKMMNPSGANMKVTFRSDPSEILKISFLMDRMLKELHSEKVLSYEKWYQNVVAKFRLSECSGEADFAKKVMDSVLSQAITRVPNSFQLFLCKKPNTKFSLPEGCSLGENMNSITCSTTTDFKYDFRIRFFVVEKFEKEVLYDDEADTPPASQDPLL